MKPVIVGGCDKCKGTMAQDAMEKNDDGTYTLEYACVTCGRRRYKRVRSLQNVKTTSYS